ncbi:MAG: ATP phosphoribosyltransferase regulatory subunit [Deltaproteobacteria bacterium]|nr:MAG: ATP phosphoribosyltransferase regulatory subunit [Deltaproteobacteria bacterium]
METRLPTGVKDFLPVKAAQLEYLQATLRTVFTRWGFRPVIPASLEELAVLELGLGGDLREKTFRFDDRQSGRLVAFPPDITPQVARIAATRLHDLPLPYRLCYSGRVLRHAEQRLGKEREIWQAGVELIGLESPEADAEMIAMTVEGLLAVGAKEFTIDVGQVAFLRGILDGLPLPPAVALELRTAIAAKDATGLQRLLDAHPVSDRQRAEVLALPRLFGGFDTLERAAAVVRNDVSRRALDNLHRVIDVLGVYGVDDYVTVDLGELRGFDYHTGVIFQGFLTGFGRAVCSGGRYDGLTARYGLPAPATGFAFNLFNLLFALGGDLDGRGEDSIDILLFCPAADKAPAQRLAAALRRQGYSVARDIIARDREASLDYARRMHFRTLLIMNETNDGLTRIHLADGRETSLSLQAVLDGECRL